MRFVNMGHLSTQQTSANKSRRGSNAIGQSETAASKYYYISEVKLEEELLTLSKFISLNRNHFPTNTITGLP